MSGATSLLCPVCGTELQRTLHGTLTAGLIRHYSVVHPDQPTPLSVANPNNGTPIKEKS